MEIFKRTRSLVKLDEYLLMLTPVEMRLIIEGLEVVEEACRKDARNKIDDSELIKQADMSNEMIIHIRDALDGHILQS